MGETPTVMHSPVIEDPDVRQAVEDFRPVIAQVRQLSAEAIELRADSPTRRSIESDVQRLMSDVGLRASRLQLSTDALVALINDDLDSRARRGRPAPTRVTTRTLMRDLVQAKAREETARLELSAANIEMKAATAARVAAEERMNAYGSGLR